MVRVSARQRGGIQTFAEAERSKIRLSEASISQELSISGILILTVQPYLG